MRILVFLLLTSFPCFGARATFTWDALPVSEDIVKYSLVDETSLGTYEEVGWTDGVSNAITIPVTEGSHHYAVMATSSDGSHSISQAFYSRATVILIEDASSNGWFLKQ